MGSFRNLMPVASATALANTAAAPATGGSPTPLAPYGPVGLGSSTASASVGSLSLIEGRA